MPAEPTVVAILDDEEKMRSALGRLLRINGFEVAFFVSGQELLQAHASANFSCIILDLHMPDMDGFEVIEEIMKSGGKAPIVVITGHDQPGSRQRIENLGVHYYLTKPVDKEPLLNAIRATIASSSTRPLNH